jgi:hypothetical protein
MCWIVGFHSTALALYSNMNVMMLLLYILKYVCTCSSGVMQHPLMLAGKQTVVWINCAANQTSANSTVTLYTLLTLRCYVIVEYISVHPVVMITRGKCGKDVKMGLNKEMKITLIKYI